MFKKLTVAAAAVVAMAAVGTASAHTVSIGVYNAGAPGSVTLAMGTYNHTGPSIFEGSMSLIAGPTLAGPVAFSSVTSVKPVGLIDGVNNFYANCAGFNCGLADNFSSSTNISGLGALIEWQELTFAGLAAGVYTYQLSGMNSVNWTNVSSGSNNWTGTFTVSGTTAGVPEPGSMALAGLALFGVAVASRRRRAA